MRNVSSETLSKTGHFFRWSFAQHFFWSREIAKFFRKMARPAGFEPAAFGCGAQCAIQGSYGRTRSPGVETKMRNSADQGRNSRDEERAGPSHPSLHTALRKPGGVTSRDRQPPGSRITAGHPGARARGPGAFESIRRLSHDLHPAIQRLLDVAPALRSHCKEVAKRQDVEVLFRSGDDIGAIDPNVAVCFFRIAQESLRNSVHGGAKHMTVALGREGEELDLAGDGRWPGFAVSAVRNNGQGLGLVTMEERVNLVGGHLSLLSVPGQGTTVRVRGPVNPRPLN